MSPASKRTQSGNGVAAAKRAASRSLRDGLEAIFRIVELNTQRISRLEDVFALQLKERDQVALALKDVRALMRGVPRQSSRRRKQSRD